jgi:hypothetical protein
MTRRHPRVEKALFQLTFDVPSPRRLRRLYAHLSGCPSCRAYYDRSLQLGAALRHDSAAREEREQLERVGRALGLAPVSRPRPMWRLVGAPALVTACVLAVLFASDAIFGSRLDGLREKGLWPGAIRGAHLHAYCVTQDPARPAVRELRPPAPWSFAPPDNRCAVADRLGFRLTTGTKAPAYAFVFGLDERLVPLWYNPLPREGASFHVTSSAGEQMLPGAVLLDRNHRPGALNIFALYSKRPLTWTEVGSAVDAARGRGESLASFSVRIDDVISQERLVIELE